MLVIVRYNKNLNNPKFVCLFVLFPQNNIDLYVFTVIVLLMNTGSSLTEVR